MASKLAQLSRRYPLVMAVLLVVLSAIAAKCGYPGHPGHGLWDGPI